MRRFPWLLWLAAIVLALLSLWGSLSHLWIAETIACGTIIGLLVTLWFLSRELERDQRHPH